jgi:hypothetical protein
VKILITKEWLRSRIAADDAAGFSDDVFACNPDYLEKFMSWSFTGTGTNKTEALEDFKEKQSKDTYCPFPDAVTAALEPLLARFNEDQVRSIETYGHINADGSGNVKVSVNC